MSDIKLKVKTMSPYGRGWQINAIIDGVESEYSFWHYTKKDAVKEAHRMIKQNGRLPHEPYRG